MLMNNLDVFLEKNPLYAIYRGRIIEAVIKKYYKDYFDRLNNKQILEIGCGSGFDTKLIKKYFHPKKIVATDLDRRLIETAQKKINDPSISFKVADATELKFKNNSFDSIFDFGVIHHIPNWKDCLKELYRVLKPRGLVFIFDVPIESFSGVRGFITRTFTLHPYKEMYTKKEFIEYLKYLKFKIISQDISKTSLVYFVLIVKK